MFFVFSISLSHLFFFLFLFVFCLCREVSPCGLQKSIFHNKKDSKITQVCPCFSCFRSPVFPVLLVKRFFLSGICYSVSPCFSFVFLIFFFLCVFPFVFPTCVLVFSVPFVLPCCPACRAFSGNGYSESFAGEKTLVMVNNSCRSSTREEASSHCAGKHWCARSFSRLSRISFAPQDALFTSAHVSSLAVTYFEDGQNCTRVGGTAAACPGPTWPSFTRSLREFRFRRGTLLCNSRRPSFTSKHCDCCINGTGCALCSGPRRPSFTSGHCSIGFSRGPLLCNSNGPHFTNRRCDCCTGGRGTVLHVITWPSNPSDFAPVVVSTACGFLRLLCDSRRPRQKVHLQSARQSPVALVHAGLTTPRRQSLPGIEVHPQFARRSVHAGPASPPRLSLPEVEAPARHPRSAGQVHHQGTRRRLPPHKILFCGVSFPASGSSLHPSSCKKRHSLAMRCTLALFLTQWPPSMNRFQFLRCLRRLDGSDRREDGRQDVQQTPPLLLSPKNGGHCGGTPLVNAAGCTQTVLFCERCQKGKR